jgi:hypothetical protein
MVKVEVVSEDVGVRENNARTHAVQKYSPTRSRTKLWRRRL